jgi:hypothetical protein
MHKDLVTYQNKLYWIYRMVNQSHIKPEHVTDIKEFWLCDIVVRDRNSENEKLLFLREIPDAEIIG